MPNVNVWKSAQSASRNVNFIWSPTSYRTSMSQARPVYWQKNTNPINNKQSTSLISKYWNKSSVLCMLSSSLLLSYYQRKQEPPPLHGAEFKCIYTHVSPSTSSTTVVHYKSFISTEDEQSCEIERLMIHPPGGSRTHYDCVYQWWKFTTGCRRCQEPTFARKRQK